MVSFEELEVMIDTRIKRLSLSLFDKPKRFTHFYIDYFFQFANASANGLFLNSSSCFFKYLLISFLDTLVFCAFFLRFWIVSIFLLFSKTHRNVCLLPSPLCFIFFLRFIHRSMVFL